MRDNELLIRIAKGDEHALEELYVEYYPRLARFLARLCSDNRIAEEAINDVFLVVWQSATRFRGDSSPSTWILGIAYKKMLKALGREQKPVPLLPQEFRASFDKTMDLREAVQQLPKTHSAVVVLAYEFGYSYREIGQILGCPENTVKTRMFHARRSLKALLEA